MAQCTFLQEFTARGFMHQCTNNEGLEQLLSSQPIPAYIGFDCTAPSLHVGSLIQIMILRLLQKHGHKPIVLVGGGTTKVGDPSGKDDARKLLSEEEIIQNTEGIKQVLSQFIHFGTGKQDAILVNNAEWLERLNYIDFLRHYGRHFSINRMLNFDSVKLRLEREQPLSFLEFNYMILQAYDFVELNKRYQCRLQIGGSDQWGNIVNGIELQRRLGREEELFGLTTPLLVTSSGAKMGKTANGAVWLSHDLRSPYDYWQFWRNTEDQDVVRFLRLFTELPAKDIEALAQLKDKDINEAKKILANEATALCHGREASLQAELTAQQTFEAKTSGAGLPTFTFNEQELAEGIPAYQLFQRCHLSQSGGDARRLIRGKGAKLNDQLIEDENQLITHKDFHDSDHIKLSSGKKHHAIIKRPMP